MKFINKTSEIVTMVINENDFIIILRALDVSLELLEDWEYQTRMGVTKADVKALIRQSKRIGN